ncbi:MAG: NOP5/NOP56 family protein [Halovenus sp.]
MTDETDPAEGAWFAGLDRGDVDAASAALADGRAETPRDWPRLAVETGFVDSTAEYYDRLHDAAIHATRRAVRERERATDQQLKHAVRAMDDCRRVANELRERVAEWAGTHDTDASVDTEYVRELADSDPAELAQPRMVSLARRATEIEAEADELATFVERAAPEVAPNLSALAGPELSARLIALAGGLESLAKKPSGTVQLLGAEDALFAHLQGGAPSPKHGIIYTHEYVRGTAAENRGSAARALAGKLAIAARVDHYSGEYRPDLEAELDDRIERIRARDTA